MTATGWIFMTVSLGFVLSLAAFCYWRVLTSPDQTPPAEGD